MSCHDCITRRRFLEWSSRSVSALALAGPVTSLLTSCGQSPLSSGTDSTTVPTSTSSENIYSFTFTENPTLQSVGGSIRRSIQAKSGTKDVYITRVSTTVAKTVSTVCTHAGCAVNSFDTNTQQYFCPCHSSIFSVDGSVVQGPATTSLPSYSSTITSTGIEVVVP